jgi:hypothetical protein
MEKAGGSIADHLSATGEAFRARCGPPPRDGVESGLDAYAEEIARLRKEGLTRGLSVEAVERVFALGFALEQMRQNLKDLERCAKEWSRQPQSND